MRGKQLFCVRIKKGKTASEEEEGIGCIRGKAEEILSVSPRNRKLQTQNYLKRSAIITKAQSKGKSSKSESTNFLYDEKKNYTEMTPRNCFSINARREKKEKRDKLRMFHVDINQKFYDFMETTTPTIKKLGNLLEFQGQSRKSRSDYQNTNESTQGYLKYVRQQDNVVKSDTPGYTYRWGNLPNIPKTSRRRLIKYFHLYDVC